MSLLVSGVLEATTTNPNWEFRRAFPKHDWRVIWRVTLCKPWRTQRAMQNIKWTGGLLPRLHLLGEDTKDPATEWFSDLVFCPWERFCWQIVFRCFSLVAFNVALWVLWLVNVFWWRKREWCKVNYRLVIQIVLMTLWAGSSIDRIWQADI